MNRTGNGQKKKIAFKNKNEGVPYPVFASRLSVGVRYSPRFPSNDRTFESKHYHRTIRGDPFPMGLPTLEEMIELGMFEMGLKRKDLATLLNTRASRISDYMNGKREITLNLVKALHQNLNYR